MGHNIYDIRPPQSVARQYRLDRLWRDITLADDVRHGAQMFPDRPVLVTRRESEGATTTITYREFDRRVDQFCRALLTLDPCPTVVAYQLPDWWETAALTLACMRLGIVAVPILITLRERELRHVLETTGAMACILPQEWGGHPYAEMLARIASDLPNLRHRLVVGHPEETSAIDFDRVFLQLAPQGPPLNMGSVDPDQICLVLFTSGTTGKAKAVLHSHNTLYRGALNVTLGAAGARPGPVVAATAQTINHLAGLSFGLLGPIACGGTGVFQDTPDTHQFLELARVSGATQIYAAPQRLFDLVDQQRQHPHRLAALRCICTAATPIPPRLVTEAENIFGVPVRASWGMTEVGCGTLVPADAAPGTSARSDGQPMPGIEIDLTSSADPQAHGDIRSLRIRGPSACLATVTPAGEPTITWDTDDGWITTGDLVREDGQGGIRFVTRTADRVGGNLLVPVREVEEELLAHPCVADVVLIGIPDEVVGEHVCAVVVPAVESPTLEQLRDFLHARGMTEWYYPTRLEVVHSLPRDSHIGKVRRDLLRAQFNKL